jgi:hypothetical protein
MSDEPKTPWIERTAGTLIGLHVVMGTVIGFLIALLNSREPVFLVRYAAIGLSFGVVGGITAWFSRPAK